MIGYLALSLILFVLDLSVKHWMILHLQPIQKIDLVPGVFSLYYHQNYGAAWGILQGKRWLLLVITAVILVALFAAMLSGKFHHKVLCLSVSLILAGGFGNLYDRIFREGGYVVDYLYFELINFPIFNLADCCVVIGTILLAFYLLFLEEKDDSGKEQQS